MVAVTTLAGGGGRVTVGGGAGCVRRIAEGKMLGGVCTSSAGKKPLQNDAQHRLIPEQHPALAAGAARG